MCPERTSLGSLAIILTGVFSSSFELRSPLIQGKHASRQLPLKPDMSGEGSRGGHEHGSDLSLCIALETNTREEPEIARKLIHTRGLQLDLAMSAMSSYELAVLDA